MDRKQAISYIVSLSNIFAGEFGCSAEDYKHTENQTREALSALGVQEDELSNLKFKG